MNAISTLESFWTKKHIIINGAKCKYIIFNNNGDKKLKARPKIKKNIFKKKGISGEYPL